MLVTPPRSDLHSGSEKKIGIQNCHRTSEQRKTTFFLSIVTEFSHFIICLTFHGYSFAKFTKAARLSSFLENIHRTLLSFSAPFFSATYSKAPHFGYQKARHRDDTPLSLFPHTAKKKHSKTWMLGL